MKSPFNRQIPIRVVAILLTCLASTAQAGEPPSGNGGYQDLVGLLDEFTVFQESEMESSGAAIATALERVGEFQARMQDMNVAAWEQGRQVDWLAVRSRLDKHEFLLRISRPWARDPGYYVDRMLRVTFTDLPLEGAAKDEFLVRIREVPALVAEAQERLDDVAADYADLAMHNLGTADGVGHGHPYRAQPPAGVLGWYEDLLVRAQAQPELIGDIEAASASVQDFQAWLGEMRPSWTAPAGVGQDAFDWYLKHVKLMPWTSAELVVLGRRELDRLWAAYALERHRNQALPELEPSRSAEEYQQRIAATDERIRNFLTEHAIITVPEDIGMLDTNAPWIERPGGRNFWEEVQFRNPSPDHLHAVIPGHRFDSLMSARLEHPVRSRVYSASRVEGWATYLEEAMLQAGLFQDLPRVRELIQIFGIFRAARVPADVWLQTRAKDVDGVVDYWLARVPYLDRNVARVDAEIYLRRPPGYGIGYTIGALQMQRLLADRKRQLGEEFDLRAFHDDFMAAGRLPMSLIRWDMTGLDDEIREFWQREPMP